MVRGRDGLPVAGAARGAPGTGRTPTTFVATSAPSISFRNCPQVPMLGTVQTGYKPGNWLGVLSRCVVAGVDEQSCELALGCATKPDCGRGRWEYFLDFCSLRF